MILRSFRKILIDFSRFREMRIQLHRTFRSRALSFFGFSHNVMVNVGRKFSRGEFYVGEIHCCKIEVDRGAGAEVSSPVENSLQTTFLSTLGNSENLVFLHKLFFCIYDGMTLFESST